MIRTDGKATSAHRWGAGREPGYGASVRDAYIALYRARARAGLPGHVRHSRGDAAGMFGFTITPEGGAHRRQNVAASVADLRGER